MKAVKIEKFGGPDVLKVESVEIGKPKTNEVLIKNLSIGINYIDTYHRTGLYPIPLPSGIGLKHVVLSKKLVLMLLYLKLEIEFLTHLCLLVLIQKNILCQKIN